MHVGFTFVLCCEPCAGCLVFCLLSSVFRLVYPVYQLSLLLADGVLVGGQT